MYKLLATDMDGTLLNDNKELSQEVIDSIKLAKSQNYKIVLCTGRSNMGINQYINILKPDLVDYVISFNGSLIKETCRDETLIKWNLTKEDLCYLDSLSKELGLPIHFVSETAIYTPNNPVGKYTVHEAFYTDMPIYQCEISNLHEDIVISKALLSGEKDKLSTQLQQLPKNFFDRFNGVKSGENYFEILNPQASKGNALKMLSEKLQIPSAEIIAIGDHENDLSMIEFAGYGVSMGNAIEDVKKAADFVTNTNNENGVAVAMMRILKNN